VRTWERVFKAEPLIALLWIRHTRLGGRERLPWKKETHIALYLCEEVLLHLGLAHFGVALALCDRTVIKGQSLMRRRSILTLESSPGGMGTGSLQSEPERNGSWTKREKKIQVRVLTIGSYPVVFIFTLFCAAVCGRLENGPRSKNCKMLAFEG